jgi:hypothetical protein
MRFDELDEILDRLQPAMFRPVAPAPQISVGLLGVAVAELLEVLPPAMRPRRRLVHRRAGQPGQRVLLDPAAFCLQRDDRHGECAGPVEI